MRDHNVDLRKYEKVDVNNYKRSYINEFLQSIKSKLPEKLYHLPNRKIWFSEDNAYSMFIHKAEYPIGSKEQNEVIKDINIEIDIIPSRYEDIYFHNENSRDKVKMSKTCKKSIVSKQSFLDVIENELEIVMFSK